MVTAGCVYGATADGCGGDGPLQVASADGASTGCQGNTKRLKWDIKEGSNIMAQSPSRLEEQGDSGNFILEWFPFN